MTKTEAKSAMQEGFDAFDLDGKASFACWETSSNKAEWIKGWAGAAAGEGWTLDDCKECARKFAMANAAAICRMFDERGEQIRARMAELRSAQ